MKRKKRILVILRRKDRGKKNKPHFVWIDDCREIYDIDFWGKDICDTSLSSLKKKVDSFKPDFLYFSLRKKYQISTYNTTNFWIPDLTTIKVPKIFVEVDTCYYDANDPWYKQFDKLYCREPLWNGWDKIPLLRWSVAKKNFPSKKIRRNKRSGIFFMGKMDGQAYEQRRNLRRLFGDKIKFIRQINLNYLNTMFSASALLCPTENYYGNYTPTKLFEFLASGAAVLTNCDMKQAGIPELEDFVIKYNDEKDLESKLDMDFSPYYNRAIPAMKNHTHVIRYRELFG